MFKTKSKAVMTLGGKGGRNTSQQHPQKTDSGSAKSQADSAHKEDPSEKVSKEKSIERFRKIVETSKVSALRKFICNKQSEPLPEHESESDNFRGKLWDESLAGMELKNIRPSQMGIKHVRIILPTPDIKEVMVKRKTKEKPKDNLSSTTIVVLANSTDPDKRAPIRALSSGFSVGVLRSLNAHIEVKPLNFQTTSFSGPKCDESGKIVAHSLLGDVGSFLKEAKRRGEFQEIRAQQKKTKTTYAPTKQSPRTPWNPLLNEDNALRHWNREMHQRCEAQRKLSAMLNCPESQLLMCKSDQFVKKMELRGVMNSVLENNEPGVSFWRLEDRLGTKQIQATLSKTERGDVTPPPISGDADSIARHKGKNCDPESNIWLQSSYVEQRDQEFGGVIHVANSVLFDELLVSGNAVYPPKQISSFKNIAGYDKGSSSSNSRDREGFLSNPLSQTSTPLKCSRGLNLCEQERKGGNSSSEAKYSPMVMQKMSEEQIPTYYDEDDSIRSIYIAGPALLIDGSVLCWQGEAEETVDMEKSVVKETFILVEGNVGEVVESYVEITNCGSTVIHYNWKKLPEVRPLPVARPKRRPFYFMADEGIILPRQTIYIPLLFRSQTQGYFGQSWLLTTVPQIERGAAIKFTFKGVACGIEDYSQECQEIEEALMKKQGRSICQYEAKRILELAILKASLQHGQLIDDVIVPGLDELFELENPGMFYHANVLHRLEEIHKTLTMDLEQAGITDTSVYNNNTLSVAKLRQAVLQLTGTTEDPDSEDAMFIVQQQLLQQLNMEVNQLSYAPVVPLNSTSQRKYCITYTMLLYGIDSVITYAQYLADKMGFMIMKEEEEEEDVEQKAGKKKKNGGKTKTKPEKQSKSKSDKRPSQTETTTAGAQNPASPDGKQDLVVHSTAYKYRTANPANPTMALYDEKTYLSMYHMLESTLDAICDLFDR